MRRERPINNLSTLIKRELNSYFYSPIAYAVIVIFLIVAGFFFYSGMSLFSVVSFEMGRTAQYAGPQELSLSEFVLRPLFGNLSVVMLLMMPLLTMRLFSEEKKSGSIELLSTWPLRDIELLLGKYLAVLIVFIIMVSITGLYIGFIWWHDSVEWSTVASGYFGLILLGASFLALGVFVSTLTENQIISAAVTFGMLLIFWMINWTVGSQTGPWADALNYISILQHYDQFSKGVLDTRDIIYYLSFIFLFLFLTLRSLESKKWRS